MIEYVIGFDGSKGRKRGRADATAIVKLPLQAPAIPALVGYWADEGEGWELPRPEIVAVVDGLLADPGCVGAGIDPSYWTEETSAWTATYGPRLKTRRLDLSMSYRARSWELLHEWIDLKVVVFDQAAPDFDMFRTSILAARLDDFTVRKDHTGPHAEGIDIAAALAYACKAREIVLAQGPARTTSEPKWPNTGSADFDGRTYPPKLQPCLGECGEETRYRFHTLECADRYRGWYPESKQMDRWDRRHKDIDKNGIIVGYRSRSSM